MIKEKKNEVFKQAVKKQFKQHLQSTFRIPFLDLLIFSLVKKNLCCKRIISLRGARNHELEDIFTHLRHDDFALEVT